MKTNITAEELIKIIGNSELDQTIKDILIRDLKNEGVNEFILEQVIAYCDNAAAALRQEIQNNTKTNQP